MYWRPKHCILNFPLTCCRHIVYSVEADVVCHKSKVKQLYQSQNSKTHVDYMTCVVTLRSDLQSRSIF